MIDLTKVATVFIGRRGEHHYRNIEFDVSSLLEDKYPGASLNAIYRRPDGIAYPVVTNYVDGVLTWSPSATDTVQVGVGRLEIRVTDCDVVGKSVRILTIVEDALDDGIVQPPEPPAQEWLNHVLSVLAELDVKEINSLLNLIYGLLTNNYDLLNTTHDLIEDMRDTLYMRTGIILNHLHPIETATAPDMVSRRGAITFTSINSGNNLVIGTVTYTFVTALGSPAANNVQVLIQGNIRNTVKKLAEAIRGIQDIANIVYGSGASPNPACTAYWTSRIFSIGDITIPSGESLFLLERAENATSPLTLTSTATATINAFTRASYLRYVLSGNATGTGGINSVRGPLQTLLPIGSVVIGGQDGLLYPTAYDCHLVTLCRQSDTSEKELDLYISNDEVNFTRISRSTPIGADSSNAGLHIDIQLRQSRVPSGYGLYISMGSDGTSASAYCDLKFTYHLYPVTLPAN
ncbi:hypothetical protein Ana3638_23835 [Anaerocolumna sedimenticola]|uniref:Uncharacterized protein n=1 Tax=Anaerocolumna sedimenticola TaxID=2696063 RepID=A0A6P1TTY5_9FIRM|nr:hypothetical protein [Anaerocolumna sedimenticola]QHQ63431.1 hypothetical protein Ana3638_23835 [Anaerocolumna sedimenticola]